MGEGSIAVSSSPEYNRDKMFLKRHCSGEQKFHRKGGEANVSSARTRAGFGRVRLDPRFGGSRGHRHLVAVGAYDRERFQQGDERASAGDLTQPTMHDLGPINDRTHANVYL